MKQERAARPPIEMVVFGHAAKLVGARIGWSL